MAKINQINVGVVGVGWVGGIRATAVKKNPIVDQLYIAEIDKKIPDGLVFIISS